MDLTTNELSLLRLIRRHVNDIYQFDLSCVPADSLNLEFLALQERKYVKQLSGTLYLLAVKARDALHQAALADERSEQLAKQAANDRAYAESQKRADEAKAAANQRKQYAHDFKVATFSIAGTLLVEHFGVVADFFSKVVEYVSALFH